ncbi:hypothetical protein PCE1_002154 [Barthelona sp. PCE]
MFTTHLKTFEELEELGSGTYGIVVRARCLEDGNIYALKKIKLESQDEGVPSTAVREISILRELNHDNIVSLVDIIHSASELTLVFEYCRYDLKKYMDAQIGMIPIADVARFLLQIIEALEYCHTNRVLHRDLKPQNLLINDDLTLKLADFGLARSIGLPIRSLTSEIITLWYRPPEVLIGERNYSFAVDMWSVGCIFAEMVLGRPLFPGSNSKDQLRRIFKVLGTPSEQSTTGMAPNRVWPGISQLPAFSDSWPVYNGQNLAGKLHSRGLSAQGVQLLLSMMVYAPHKRISTTQARFHAFFRETHSTCPRHKL